MYVCTEVATAKHVYECLKAGIDLLWIGARTTANPFAVQEIADALRGVDIPVLVKNPVNPDLELWIGALERINQAGLKRLAAIHRGFSSYEKKIYRNLPQWHIPIELRRRSANSSPRCASRPWTWASTASSWRATAIRTRPGAMPRSR